MEGYCEFLVVAGVLEDDGLAEEASVEGVQDVPALLEGLLVVVLVGDDDAKAGWGGGYLLALWSRAHS